MTIEIKAPFVLCNGGFSNTEDTIFKLLTHGIIQKNKREALFQRPCKTKFLWPNSDSLDSAVQGEDQVQKPNLKASGGVKVSKPAPTCQFPELTKILIQVREK